MATLSTHVLDTSTGQPAPGIPVTLERDGVALAHGITDADGRIREFGAAGAVLPAGRYRLVFAVDGYFARRQVDAFYPAITVLFTLRDQGHYHVPLLLSPFGYATYRGS
jgi:5-hydroxyisourate hydrolase